MKNSVSLTNGDLMIREIPFRGPGFADWVSLRQKILRDPLGLAYSQEDIDAEAEQAHFGYYRSERLVGGLIVVLIEPDVFKIRQVVVEPNCQREGIGRQLMMFAEDVIKSRGGTSVVLHARLDVVLFYEKLDYVGVGNPFQEVGIPHVKMQKSINGRM